MESPCKMYYLRESEQLFGNDVEDTFEIHEHLVYQCSGTRTHQAVSNYDINISVYLYFHFIFIRPFEKRTYYAMAMSVRLSVRPSVRPSFPDFFSTCFEISIWNLVYAFSRWHDMSSLSFITIGSLWPSLQPKVGQTQFLQSWPYKSR